MLFVILSEAKDLMALQRPGQFETAMRSFASLRMTERDFRIYG
jgi:hypothetical protein